MVSTGLNYSHTIGIAAFEGRGFMNPIDIKYHDGILYVLSRSNGSNKNNNGKPSLKTETPKRGIAKIAAGTKPISALKIAVNVREVMISLILIGAINKFVKFLLQISSKNIILKLILTLNRKSYKIAAVKIIPTVLL